MVCLFFVCLWWCGGGGCGSGGGGSGGGGFLFVLFFVLFCLGRGGEGALSIFPLVFVPELCVAYALHQDQDKIQLLGK